MGEDRRRFERISFDAPVEICQDGLSWESTIVDISLKGALVEGEGLAFDPGKPIQIKINLGTEARVNLNAIWANSHNQGHAFQWDEIELEDMIHLRRLLELNAPNEELLDRELAKLGNDF